MEKEQHPLDRWRDNLKEGDLIRVIHYHYSHIAVFKSFRPGNGTYTGCRMQYYLIPNGSYQSQWYKERLDKWEKGEESPYVCYINARGEDRVLPLGINMLSQEEHNYYKRLKRLVT